MSVQLAKLQVYVKIRKPYLQKYQKLIKPEITTLITTLIDILKDIKEC